jgi:hypothetical protein
MNDHHHDLNYSDDDHHKRFELDYVYVKYDFSQ